MMLNSQTFLALGVVSAHRWQQVEFTLPPLWRHDSSHVLRVTLCQQHMLFRLFLSHVQALTLDVRNKSSQQYAQGSAMGRQRLLLLLCMLSFSSVFVTSHSVASNATARSPAGMLKAAALAKDSNGSKAKIAGDADPDTAQTAYKPKKDYDYDQGYYPYEPKPEPEPEPEPECPNAQSADAVDEGECSKGCMVRFIVMYKTKLPYSLL
jgi:hypothetical protein